MATAMKFGARLGLATLFVLTAAGCEFDVEYVVNTTEDLPDLNPGDGVCAVNKAGDLCSLRAAFEETNATVDTLAVRISVPAGSYPLTKGSPLELTRGHTHVLGEGVGATFVDGLDQTRIVDISGSKADEIVFEGVTLLNGRAPYDYYAFEGHGGAVHIESSNYLVTFLDSALLNNVSGLAGGGIYAEGPGVLMVINSLMAGNSSSLYSECDDTGDIDSGGAIHIYQGTLNLIQSEVRDNCGAWGGGIALNDGANHLILRSTIAGNMSIDGIAGVGVVDTNVRIEDSTIAGNRVIYRSAYWPRRVGGLFVEGPDNVGSDVEILNSTIVDNDTQGGDSSQSASGIYVDNDSKVTLQNTVIASHDTAPACHGNLVSLGGNFLGAGDPACQFDSVASDIIDGGDPGLNALAYNGGLTRTMLPTSYSPLVDAGIPGCEDIDQRGLDYPAPKGKACDIGAVER